MTASSAGIGAAIARSLAAEGCAVLVHGRNGRRAETVAEEIRAAGGRAEVVLADLTDATAADRLADRAHDWGVQIVVNNAGPFIEHTWADADLAAWTASFESNVLTTVRLIRALLPTLTSGGWGRVINIGTRGATTPLPNMVDYSAAKAAVVNLTASLARHLAGTGVTANVVSPGVILTQGLSHMFELRAAESGWTTAQTQQQTADYAPNPVGRLGTTDDIAAAVTYLASPVADYVNGTELRVDGGITPVP